MSSRKALRMMFSLERSCSGSLATRSARSSGSLRAGIRALERDVTKLLRRGVVPQQRQRQKEEDE